ncbi:YheC/YheD family protein [Paenibacillus sp. MBLB4367]|uniref:YheC/YheD family endospore coat-associated protein n=1 Tax=Paenibacillus sp. MBLB4367 TaxID=3384767 RepID=UPI0039082339
MSSTTCTVLVSQQFVNTVTLSRELAKTLKINPTKTITVRLGSKSVTVPLKIMNRKGSVCSLPQSVASMLKLPWTGSCQIRSANGDDIQLGPLVGVLAMNTSDPQQPFGSLTPFVRDFMRAGTNKAFYYAFSPQQVNWNEGVVTGLIPDDEGGWVRKTLPLPDVVYNRLSSRKAEKTISMESFKDKFVRRKIPLFNWSFFDKWDVYRLLEGEDAAKYVPESVIDPSPEEIKKMMEKHRFVFLKPTNGSLGIGIYRLTYNPEKGYFARFRKNGSNTLIRFPRFDGLMKMLNRHNIRLEGYVLQQGIRLIEMDSCPIDFRFHMTKNGLNEWVPAGIGAKKAGRGSVTTHVRTGGQLMTPEYVLTQLFGKRAEQVLEHTKEVAIQLAEAIERRYPHPLGELGFDIGIDSNEDVWMFEANAKPGRSIFKHPSLKAQGKASISNLVDHCFYLSRFRVRREG